MAPRSTAECDALLDTGSDNTLFPASLAMELGLVPVDEVIVEEGANMRSCLTYLVDLELPWSRLSEIEVPADDQREYALVGRDVLNQMRLTFDGPAGQITE